MHAGGTLCEAAVSIDALDRPGITVMKKRGIVFPGMLMVLLLAGCEAMLATKYDVNSEYYHVPAGSKLTLHQTLQIPAERARVRLQHGTVVPGVDQYAVNCEFEVRNLGPVVVTPDTFTIRRAERSWQWVSQPNIMRFYRVLHLESATQPDVLKLVCQDWDDPLLGRSISIPEIREAVGDIITLEFASR